MALTWSCDHFLAQGNGQEHSIMCQIFKRQPSHSGWKKWVFHNISVHVITKSFVSHIVMKALTGGNTIFNQFTHLEVTKSKFNYVKLRVTCIFWFDILVTFSDFFSNYETCVFVYNAVRSIIIEYFHWKITQKVKLSLGSHKFTAKIQQSVIKLINLLQEFIWFWKCVTVSYFVNVMTYRSTQQKDTWNNSIWKKLRETKQFSPSRLFCFFVVYTTMKVKDNRFHAFFFTWNNLS